MRNYRLAVENCASACLDGEGVSQMEEGMETVITVLVFLGAAFVGRLAGRSRLAGYVDNHRWLRVGALALAFFLMATILTGGPPHL
jgi:fucose permease